MATDRELTGVVRPEMDERALDRETSKVERKLDSAAQLTPDIDARSLQRKLERAIPGGQLAGSAARRLRSRRSGGGQQDDDGSAVGGAATASMLTVQKKTLDAQQASADFDEKRNEILDDIHEELKKSGVSGAGGGGGGGGSGGSGGGGGGLLGTGVGPDVSGLEALGGYKLLQGGKSRLPGSLGRLAPSTATGAVVGGTTAAFGGINALDRMGVYEGAEAAGEQAGQDSPEWARDASQFMPGLSILAGAPGTGQAIFGGSPPGEEDRGPLGNRVEGLKRANRDFSTVWSRRTESLGDVFSGNEDAYSQQGISESEIQQVVEKVEGDPARVEKQNEEIRQARDVSEDFDLRDYMDTAEDPYSPPDEPVAHRDSGDTTITGGHTTPVAGQGSPSQEQMQQQAEENQSIREDNMLGGHTTPVAGQGSPSQEQMQQQAEENQEAAYGLNGSDDTTTGDDITGSAYEGSMAQRSRVGDSSPSSPGSEQQAAQVTNDITIDASSMQELQREIERKIEAAMREFNDGISGGPGRFGP